MRAVQAQQQPIEDYEDYEEDNWGGEEDDYEEEEYEEKPQYTRAEISRPKQPVVEYEDDVEADAWADDEAPKPYQAPRVNIPEKTKTPEYEEEPGY